MHKAYEDNFWSTKMALKGCSSDALARTKTDYDAFLADAERLAAVRKIAATPGITPEQAKVLAIMEKTFK